MKPYFVLLAVLYAVTVFVDVLVLINPASNLFLLRALGDVVLLSLCMVGCYNLAWQKTLLNWEPMKWRMVYQGTLVLGGFYVVMKNYGDLLGAPTMAGETSLLQVFLDFLPYLLFALPVILLDHKLRNPQAELD